MQAKHHKIKINKFGRKKKLSIIFALKIKKLRLRDAKQPLWVQCSHMEGRLHTSAII